MPVLGGTWSCPICRETKPRGEPCRCSACPMPEEDEEALEACSSDSDREEGPTTTPGNPTTTVQVPKPGDWYCSSPICGNLNFAKRHTCNRCGNPQPGYTAGYTAAMAAMGMNSMGVSQAPRAHGVPMMGPSGGYPGGELPADWKCLQCCNVNYARRHVCNKCGVPKEGNASDEQVSVLGRSYWTPSPYSVYPPAPSYYPPQPYSIGPTRMLAGDWICPFCTNLNFARRVVCNKCHEPKPPDETQ
eukprot:NODE_3554_length_1200_cov_133.418756_g3374_i0.p1 GENE.NODE_3554_length_1200_cov_133.418756_g3374_i0~~NODE_3554_length_1200_cov_133.418756_g3374_i0.p1  ORF type:complete len:264 (+),score=31.46 NODE_3554_length_1200_cov_133.418756_g3374_i0:58-792(+)